MNKYRTVSGKKDYKNTWDGKTRFEDHFTKGYQQRIDDLMQDIKKELEIEIQRLKQKKRTHGE